MTLFREANLVALKMKSEKQNAFTKPAISQLSRFYRTTFTEYKYFFYLITEIGQINTSNIIIWK